VSRLLSLAFGDKRRCAVVLERRGEYWYGDSAADIRALLARDRPGSDPVVVFEDAICDCGGKVFSVQIDDEYHEAAWFCRDCDAQYLFHTRNIDGFYEGDPEADTECCNCPCTDRGGSYFEITVGASLYEPSDVVRWVYIGCRCVACRRTGYLAEWHRVEIPYPKLFGTCLAGSTAEKPGFFAC
jgi:hypothetical protein